MLPFFIGLVCIPASASNWVRYALLTGINSIPYAHAILVGMISHNAHGVGTRAVAAAIYNMTYQVGSIAASNIYREGDKPHCMSLSALSHNAPCIRLLGEVARVLTRFRHRLQGQQRAHGPLRIQHSSIRCYEAVLRMAQPCCREEARRSIRSRKAGCHRLEIRALSWGSGSEKKRRLGISRASHGA